MKILVTGATGFIGQSLIGALLGKNHDIVALARNLEKAKQASWYKHVRFVSLDIENFTDHEISPLQSWPDAVIHLAWPGLPNYCQTFHCEQTLINQMRFLRLLIEGNLNHLIVAGTCFEYGLHEGAVREQDTAKPVTFYGLAKLSLYRYIELLCKQQDVLLQWPRLFYIYSDQPAPNSLFWHLNHAINTQQKVFNMSGGQQWLDYQTIEQTIDKIITLMEHKACTNITNISSGKPTLLYDLVRAHAKKYHFDITFNTGYYPYREYEPMQFWGAQDKFLHFCKKQQTR